MAIPRTAMCDTEQAGHRIAEGGQVMVSLPVANRDPAFVGDGDVFDVDRAPHVAFGFGIHHCLGAGLARAEMAIAFPALLRRLPDLALAVPDEDVGRTPAVRASRDRGQPSGSEGERTPLFVMSEEQGAGAAGRLSEHRGGGMIELSTSHLDV